MVGFLLRLLRAERIETAGRLVDVPEAREEEAPTDDTGLLGGFSETSIAAVRSILLFSAGSP